MFRPVVKASERMLKRPRRKPAAKISRAAAMTLDRLEERRLMSATLVGGLLDVVGTSGNDKITVKLAKGDPTTLNVVINASPHTFPLASVQSIDVYGLAGNDSIAISDVNGAVPVPAFVSGGAGDDTLVGSASGNDSLCGGQGDDMIQSSGTGNLLQGGRAADTLSGGAGDQINAGLGQNLVSSNNGGSFVVDAAQPIRTVSSASVGSTLMTPQYIEAPVTGSSGTPAEGINNPFIVGYTPQQVRAAYGFGQLNSSTTTNLGQGQTIAIVDAFDSPTVENDLTVFSQEFGLPLPTPQTFEKVFATGTQPITDPDFDTEIDLDVEWAHVIAPDAKIVLVEAATDAQSDLANAEIVAGQLLTASPAGGGVVSMSFGAAEGTVATDSDTSYANDQIFESFPNVSFFAGSGDSGQGIPVYPAMSPYVTGVGGTLLTLNADGSRVSEVAWSGSGGGISPVEPEPQYQQDSLGIQAIIPTSIDTPARIGPDVAFMSESPDGGVAIYDSAPNPDGNTGWQAVGGTSLATPMFAATVALANQVRAQDGQPVIGGNLNNAIYFVNSNPQLASRDFNPILADATALVTQPNFTLATGWGTPIPANFAADLGTFGLSGTTPPQEDENVTISDINLSGTLYNSNVTPTAGNAQVVDTIQGNEEGTATSVGPNTININISGEEVAAGQLIPPEQIVPDQNFDTTVDFNLATGAFQGVFAGTGFLAGETLEIEGNVTNDGQSIGGSIFTVQVAADGTITPVGPAGVNGNGNSSYTTFQG
jgi:hypothetical protein